MGLVEWAAPPTSAHRTWDKWASAAVGSSPDHPLSAALLLNYDPAAPSRALPIIAEQRGTTLAPADLSPFVEAVRRNNLAEEMFFIGSKQYLVTSIHEHGFCARCLSSSKPGGEGVIVVQASSSLLVALYEGARPAASRAMAAVDRFSTPLSRKPL